MEFSKQRLVTIGVILLAAVLSTAFVLTGIAMTKGSDLTRQTKDSGNCDETKIAKLVKDLNNICGISTGFTVNYGDADVTCDASLTVDNTKNTPKVKYQNAREGAEYTMLLLDPDASGSSVKGLTFFLHWLVTNIKGKDLKETGLTGKDITKYYGPNPPSGTGPHRYQFLLFETTQEITHPGGDDRGDFSLREFMETNGICTITDAFEMKVEVKES